MNKIVPPYTQTQLGERGSQTTDPNAMPLNDFILEAMQIPGNTAERLSLIDEKSNILFSKSNNRTADDESAFQFQKHGKVVNNSRVDNNLSKIVKFFDHV